MAVMAFSPVSASSESSSGSSESSSAPLKESLLNRSFSKMTSGGVRQSTLTLVSTAVGGGVLSVSYVLYLAGIGAGCAMLAIGALLSYMSAAILMELSIETGIGTYSELFSHCAGRVAGPVLDSILFSFGFGACIGYFVLIGDFIPALMVLIPGVPEWAASRWFAICAAAIIVTPAAVQRELGFLRHLAPISTLTLLYVTAVVAAKMPFRYAGLAGVEEDVAPAPDITWVNLSPRLFDAFAICVFAYNCHLNIVPVARSLVRPTRARINKVSSYVNVTQLLFYTFMAVAGHLSFIEDTPQDILNGYDHWDSAIAAARVLLSMTILVAIPVNLIPTIQSGLLLIDAIAGKARDPHDTESVQDAGATRRVMLAVAVVLAQAFVAIQVPGIAVIISLLGATCATMMMFVIPAYCMRAAMPRTKKNFAKQAALIGFGLVSFASVPVTVLRWAGYLEQ